MKNKFIISGSISMALAVMAWVTATGETPPANESAKKMPMTAPANDHKFVGPADLQWGAVPPGLPPGGQMAVLDGDPTKSGSFTVRLKIAGGVQNIAAYASDPGAGYSGLGHGLSGDG